MNVQHAREEEIAERKAMKRAERDIARKKEFVRRVRLQIEEKRAEVSSSHNFVFPRRTPLPPTPTRHLHITQLGHRVQRSWMYLLMLTLVATYTMSQCSMQPSPPQFEDCVVVSAQTSCTVHTHQQLVLHPVNRWLGNQGSL